MRLHLSPTVASFLCWSFIFWLFWRDLRQKSNVTSALWIPFAWFVTDFSRPLTVWLTMFGLPVPGGSSIDGGTPMEACFQFGMIVVGLVILGKRNVTFAAILKHNVWIAVFLAYCLLAVLWSDYTFVAMKRWLKDLGLPIMALVVLSEPDPMEAITRLLKRCAYIVVPISILFIKYYPQWGRSYNEWSGAAEYNGITGGKNMLGADCLILGFLFIWQLLRVREVPRRRRDKAWWNELLLCVGFVWMIGWLFYMSNSRTPLVSLSVGVSVMLFAGWKRVRKDFIGTYLLAGILLIWSVQATFDVYGATLKLLGRNPTLTDRTYLWHDLLNLDTNPVIGVGFESFWLGWQNKLPEEWETEINESHNGYLEIYLTLGGIGIALLLAMLFATYRRACKELLINVQAGRFRLGFVVAVVIYNWTEAGFRSIDQVMQMFYLIALNCPKPRLDFEPRAIEEENVEFEPELAESDAGRRRTVDSGRQRTEDEKTGHGERAASKNRKQTSVF
jgi:exopolysaccharide production protein ExoQ